MKESIFKYQIRVFITNFIIITFLCSHIVSYAQNNAQPSTANKLVLKLSPNQKCTIKVDGENKGIIDSNGVKKVYLSKGVFKIEAVSVKNMLDACTIIYTVGEEELNTENLFDIDLLKIKNERLEENSKKAKEYLDAGMSYYNQRKYDLAIANFTKVIEIDPKNSYAYEMRGNAYNTITPGKYNLAFADYSKAIELNPESSQAYSSRGGIYFWRKNYDMALTDYTKAIEVDPQNLYAYVWLGNTFHAMSKNDLALVEYAKALELYPDYKIAYYFRAIVFYDQAKYELAIIDYTTAIDVDPSAYRLRGEAYYKLGKNENAISDFTKAVDLGDTSAKEKLKEYFKIDDIRIANEQASQKAIEDAKEKAAEDARTKLKINIIDVITEIDKNMVSVQGGTFTMGCTSEPDRTCNNDEIPTHSVNVSNFKISKYEVTQKQWETIMGNTPSSFKDCEECPVEMVNWDDIQEFLQKLNKASGKTYRLPTEAEWEYAAQGGKKSATPNRTTNNLKYAGSNNLNDVAWYDENSGGKPHPVGQKTPNEIGIFDMSGNVWEWCNDWYKGYPNSVGVPDYSESYRVNRGGSFGFNAQSCLSIKRSFDKPDKRNSNLGFRLVCTQ